jgi:putative methyltransferase (TIGR04325 family)
MAFRPLLKGFARDLIPRSLVRLLPPAPATYAGRYASWEEAAAQATGYDAAVILERVKEATLKVRRGEAAYERDSVVFPTIQYAWPVLAGLLRAALEDRRLSVLDFGGSLGTSYHQSRRSLGAVSGLEWSIVEQPHFVACGRELFQDATLRFYSTVSECLSHRQPNVILLSSVLHYLPDPESVTRQLRAASASWCIIDRTPVTTGETFVSVQMVPPAIYPASYPVRLAPAKAWLAMFPEFAVEAEFDSACDPSRPYRHVGFLLRRISKPRDPSSTSCASA